MDDKIAKLRKLSEYFSAEAVEVASHILDDPAFPVWSGSSKPFQHHYGDGLLIEHTYEVVVLCQENTKVLNVDLNREVLFLAALYHDYGKIWDYQKVNGVWGARLHKRLIHHISRSAIEFNLIAKNYKFAEEVTHCILSHHGQREFGSPVAPKTKEAWMLHLCDGISARMNDADKLDVVDRKPE